MDLHDANWERFCRYHVGDWYGLWTPYTVDGVALAPRQCIPTATLIRTRSTDTPGHTELGLLGRR